MGLRFAAVNVLEDGLEGLLKFSTPVCTLWHCTRIEHGGIIVKRQPKTLPRSSNAQIKLPSAFLTSDSTGWGGD